MVLFQIPTATNIWISETSEQQTFACSLLRSPLYTGSLLDNSWWGLDRPTSHQQRWFLSAEAGSHFRSLFRISICVQKQDPSSSGLSYRPPRLSLRACKFPAKYWQNTVGIWKSELVQYSNGWKQFDRKMVPYSGHGLNSEQKVHYSSLSQGTSLPEFK